MGHNLEGLETDSGVMQYQSSKVDNPLEQWKATQPKLGHFLWLLMKLPIAMIRPRGLDSLKP
jgi:hypothetical protein